MLDTADNARWRDYCWLSCSNWGSYNQITQQVTVHLFEKQGSLLVTKMMPNTLVLFLCTINCTAHQLYPNTERIINFSRGAFVHVEWFQSFYGTTLLDPTLNTRNHAYHHLSLEDKKSILLWFWNLQLQFEYSAQLIVQPHFSHCRGWITQALSSLHLFCSPSHWAKTSLWTTHYSDENLRCPYKFVTQTT